ncbi:MULTISPECIES: hypothetical protein [unclassified Streptomyces]|uniref:hypothetical protein n=1 Tax=unclassified Streptomyces TaxID=2593676 RepID=UPI003648A43C
MKDALVSAATKTTAPPTGRRVPLSDRAAAQARGHKPTALSRVTASSAAATPATAAFQSSV